MPELPEVETIVRGLAPRLRGVELTDPSLLKRDVLRGVSPRRLLGTLRNATVVEVTRRAKHIVIELHGDQRLVIQPRMTGSLIVYDRPLTPSEERYTVLHCGIAGTSASLVFRDVRRLGTISLLNDRQWETYTARIGPEPLDASFTAGKLGRILRDRRQAIKKVLMDQRLLAGIGNIYANEALFRARIDPSRAAGSLDDQDVRRLYTAITKILSAAIRASGTTFRDYRTGTGERGGYQKILHVYGRGGLPCHECGTHLATTHAIDGRATTFCWRCQRTMNPCRSP